MRSRVVILPAEGTALDIVDVDLPDPRDHEVVVELAATGVCHSQLHNMHAPNRTTATVLGHEAAGIVVAIGDRVERVQPGDHVVVTWIPRVDPRRPIAPVLDVPSYGRVAVRDVFTWATRTVVDELLVVPIPRDVDLALAAVVGCAVMTGAGAVLHSARVPAGASVVVIGAGGVGLCAIAAARRSRANPVIAVDLSAAKLDMARAFGATHVIDASAVDAVDAVRELTRSQRGHDALGQPVRGADFVFDCVGMSVTTADAIAMARNAWFGRSPGGTAVIVGVPQTRFDLDAAGLLITEKHIIGSLGGSSVPERDVPELLEWHRRGEFDLAALVTARYRIDDINRATGDLETGVISGRCIVDLV